MKSLFITLLLSFIYMNLSAQKVEKSSSALEVAKFVQLDSLTVIASKKGFSVYDFIDLVMSDTTFARAFYNMRTSEFIAENHFEFFDSKNNEIIAASRWTETQHYIDSCRWCISSEFEKEGSYYKLNGEENYYTSTLFTSAFYSRSKRCYEKPGVQIDIETLDGMAKRMEQLKRVIFTPGSSVDDLPIMGKRMAIFSDNMISKYDYAIRTEFTADSIECYVFSVKEKDGLNRLKRGSVVLKYMESWFDKSNFHIISRTYHLRDKSMFYEFDVHMDVKVQQYEERYYLQNIVYDGFWDIPLKKEERCKAEVSFSFENAQ